MPLLEISLDFGRGPATVHFRLAPDPKPLEPEQVIHEGADITDSLSDAERQTIRQMLGAQYGQL